LAKCGRAIHESGARFAGWSLVEHWLLERDGDRSPEAQPYSPPNPFAEAESDTKTAETESDAKTR
jgi:hypothetical protein